MATSKLYKLSPIASASDSGVNPLPRRRVLVGRSGQLFVVDPACPELYRDFYTLRHHPEDDMRHGCRVVRRPYPLVFEQDDAAGEPVSVCLAGLEPLVTQRLKQLGYDVQTAKQRRTLPAPGPLPWDLSEAADRSLLSLVQQQDRGLIHFDPRRVQPARLIAQVAIAWRRARIVVVTTRISDAWKLKKMLAEFIRPSEITVFTNRTCPTKAGRVVVGTYTQMGVGAVELHRRHILFALNPTEMLADACGRDVIRAATAARFYGFVPADQIPNPYYRDLLLALFGGHRVRIPSHGKIVRPVDVVFCRIYGGPRMTHDADLVSVKRQGIWEHPLRNRRIVTLARALAARDLDEVEQKFPEVFPVLNQFRRARIGILVDNVDHGLTLSRRLAGWPVIASADMARDGLSSKDRFVLRQGRSAAAKSAKTVIVTSRCLHDAGALDIIVRADGGLGVPQVKLDSVRPFGSRRPRDVLIIDFDDRHHRMLRARFKQRRKSYLETGWKLLQDRQTDLERFMAQRPEVTWT